MLKSTLQSPRDIKRYIRRLFWLGVALIPLQSCGPSRLATDCGHLQNVTYTLSPSASELIREQQLNKSDAIVASKQQQTLARQLAQIPLLDQGLNRYRNELVTLYRHDSDLALQVTAFMSDSGEIAVAGSNRAAYEQVASQRIAISQQVQSLHNYIAGYCGASEFRR